jgi:hypothetical protein
MRLVGANRVGALKSATIRYVKFEEPDEYAALEQGTVTGLAIARTGQLRAQGQDLRRRHAHLRRPQRDPAPGAARRPAQVAPALPRLRAPAGAGVGAAQVGRRRPDTARYACSLRGTERRAAWKAAQLRERPARHDRAAGQGRRPGLLGSHRRGSLAWPAGAGWKRWPPRSAGAPGRACCGRLAGAQGDDEKLRIFNNNLRGMPYKDSVRSDVGAEQLQQRAEAYDLMTCPHGGLVMHRRRRHARQPPGRRHPRVRPRRGKLGRVARRDLRRPVGARDLGQAARAARSAHPHASGQIMRVDAAAIDAGGHHGEDVYAFCRDASCAASTGSPSAAPRAYDAPKLGRPKTIDFTWRGRPWPVAPSCASSARRPSRT